jgi:hypothetical protein
MPDGIAAAIKHSIGGFQVLVDPPLYVPLERKTTMQMALN